MPTTFSLSLRLVWILGTPISGFTALLSRAGEGWWVPWPDWALCPLRLAMWRWPECTEAGSAPALVLGYILCLGDDAGAEQKLTLNMEEAVSFFPCPPHVILLSPTMPKLLSGRMLPVITVRFYPLTDQLGFRASIFLVIIQRSGYCPLCFFSG